MIFVLDNSVVMRWCFDDAHPYAEPILERLETGDTAIVPTLWLYEVSAVLVQAQLRGIVTAQKADEFVDELQSLSIQADSESAARIFPDVHRLALAYRLTSYDAAYLEVAIRRGLPIATLGNELARASKAAGVAVL